MILDVLAETEIPDLLEGGGDAGPESWAHWLYRIYTGDHLIYIGSARDLVARMQVHASSMHNLTSVAINTYATRLTAEKVTGRSAAREAERLAITSEAPLLNKHHNIGRSVLRSAETWAVVEPLLRAEAAAHRDGIWERAS